MYANPAAGEPAGRVAMQEPIDAISPGKTKPDLAGRRVLVIGLGATGLAASKFLAARGARVFLQDDAPASRIAEALAEMEPLAEAARVGGETWSDLRGFHLVIPSPGVPRDADILKTALSAGVPVWSEIELAFRFLGMPLIAITGSNGKSTTTSLIGEMMRSAHRIAFVGGNLGTPLLACADGSQEEEVAVAEISSFQLEHVEAFRPGIALLLNLCEDHLDRHRSFEEYAYAKARIFERQTPDDLLILNADDTRVMRLAARASSRRRVFSLTRSLSEGIFHRRGKLIHREGELEERYDLGSLRIAGPHNLENVMASILAAHAWGVPADAIRRAMANFRGLPHRMQHVRDVDGVSYYNDSKGTNAGATVRSIQSFTRPVVLIAGGKDKGGGYGPLREAAPGSVKAVVLVGEAAPMIEKALGGVVQTIRVEGFAEAVAKAHEQAEPGDVVLLSPACSSFDMFKNFAERGDRFADLVRAL
jgi:UDP-N-acetylmuramoylalanine--D-glutamate ligase